MIPVRALNAENAVGVVDAVHTVDAVAVVHALDTVDAVDARGTEMPITKVQEPSLLSQLLSNDSKEQDSLSLLPLLLPNETKAAKSRRGQ